MEEMERKDLGGWVEWGASVRCGLRLQVVSVSDASRGDRIGLMMDTSDVAEVDDRGP